MGRLLIEEKRKINVKESKRWGEAWGAVGRIKLGPGEGTYLFQFTDQ